MNRDPSPRETGSSKETAFFWDLGRSFADSAGVTGKLIARTEQRAFTPDRVVPFKVERNR